MDYIKSAYFLHLTPSFNGKMREFTSGYNRFQDGEKVPNFCREQYIHPDTTVDTKWVWLKLIIKYRPNMGVVMEINVQKQG